MPLTQQSVHLAYMKNGKPTARSKIFGFDVWEEVDGEEIPVTERNPSKFAIRETYEDKTSRLLLPQGDIPEPEFIPLISDMNSEAKENYSGCKYTFEKINRP